MAKEISKTLYLWAYPKSSAPADTGVVEDGLFRYEISSNDQTVYESGQILIDTKTITFNVPYIEEKLIVSSLKILDKDKKAARNSLTLTLTMIERIENSLKQITFEGESEILPKDKDDDTPF